MSEIRVRPKIDGVQDRSDPERDRIVALPGVAPSRRRRYGGSLLGASVLLLLVGGLAIGGWRDYQAKLDVAATARQSRSPSQHQQDHRHLASDHDGV
jgi:hypothetical protein